MPVIPVNVFIKEDKLNRMEKLGNKEMLIDENDTCGEP